MSRLCRHVIIVTWISVCNRVFDTHVITCINTRMQTQIFPIGAVNKMRTQRSNEERCPAGSLQPLANTLLPNELRGLCAAEHHAESHTHTHAL